MNMPCAYSTLEFVQPAIRKPVCGTELLDEGFDNMASTFSPSPRTRVRREIHRGAKTGEKLQASLCI